MKNPMGSVSTGPFYTFNIDMAIGHQVYFLKSQKVSGIIRFDGCQTNCTQEKSLQETKKLFALFLKINCQKNIC